MERKKKLECFETAPPCWRHLKLKIQTRASASRFMYKSNNFWNKSWAHSFLFQSEPDNKNTVSNITTTYPCIMPASAIMFSRDCCSRCRCSQHYSQTLFTYSYQSHMQDLHWSASQSMPPTGQSICWLSVVPVQAVVDHLGLLGTCWHSVQYLQVYKFNFWNVLQSVFFSTTPKWKTLYEHFRQCSQDEKADNNA